MVFQPHVRKLLNDSVCVCACIQYAHNHGHIGVYACDWDKSAVARLCACLVDDDRVRWFEYIDIL